MSSYPRPPTLKSAASRHGQSIIEAVIAITVLTTGFLGISSLLARSLVLTSTLSSRITANYLAAEGIELAKNLIDHDVYEALSNDPTYFWGACFSYPHNDVEIDYTTTDCNDMAFFSAGDTLFYDPVTNLYSYYPPLQDGGYRLVLPGRYKSVRQVMK